MLLIWANSSSSSWRQAAGSSAASTSRGKAASAPPVLVHRRDLREGRGPLGATSTAHRPRRAADRFGAERQARHAPARRFLRRLVEVTEGRPLHVTTDHHPAYPRAVRWILGRRVRDRRQRYLNNFIEQELRALKQRDSPMRGFGSFASAARFCSAFDELRRYFRWRRRLAALGAGCGVRPTGHGGPPLRSSRALRFDASVGL